MDSQVLEGTLNTVFFNEKSLQAVGSIYADGKRVPVRGNLASEFSGLNVTLTGHYENINKETIFVVKDVAPSKDWDLWYDSILPGLNKRYIKVLARERDEGWGFLTGNSGMPESLSQIPGDEMAEIQRTTQKSLGFTHKVSELSAMGLSQKSAIAVLREETGITLSDIRKNIYVLAKVPDVPFIEIDNAAKKEGYRANDPRRLAGAAAYVLFSYMREGHTTLIKDIPFDEKNPHLLKYNARNLREDMSRLLLNNTGFTGNPIEFETLKTVKGKTVKRVLNDVFQAALDHAGDIYRTPEGKKLFAIPEKGNTFNYAPLFWKEIQLAQSLDRLRNERAKSLMPKLSRAKAIQFLDAHFPSLDPNQREAVLAVIDDPLVIWTGGPGVGKTASVVALVAMLLYLGLDEIALCATTGNAALKMESNLLAYNDGSLQAFVETYRPSTIHHLLRLRAGEEQSIYRHKDHPLERQVVIADEFSMSDTMLSSTLLWALREGTRVILIGDARQLESVGPGAVLYDVTYGMEKSERLAETEKPKWCKFTIKHRNTTTISDLSDSIWLNTSEERLAKFNELLEKGKASGEIEVYSFKTGDEAKNKVLEIAKISDLILTPRYDGILGIDALNYMAQDDLNPGQGKETIWGFRVKDKVVQMLPDKRNDIRNGEAGVVTEVTKGYRGELPKVKVEFPSIHGEKRIIEHERFEIGMNWSLGYVRSIHRAQGGEAKSVLCVIVMKGWDQSLLYTAISRAREKLFIVELEGGLEKAVLQEHTKRRCALISRYIRVLEKAKKEKGQ